MNNNAQSIATPLSEAPQEQRFFPAGRLRLDPAELERLRQRDRETRLSFAAMRRSADAYLRSQRP